MAIAQVKITYRQIIDANAEADFDRNIFHTSYHEFLLKSPVFNAERKFRTFTQMVKNNHRANELHYQLSLAVMHFLDNLKGEIPGLKDTLGQNIAFETPEFRLIESDLLDRSAHRCEITYTTKKLILHQIIGDYLLLSAQVNNPDSRKEEANSFMLKIQPNFAITGYQEYKNRVASDFTGFAAN